MKLSLARPAAGPRIPEEFADWVRPSLPAMARLATRLSSADEADDVVQESLVRAWSKRAQFDPARGSLSSWLLAITADQARKARGRRRPAALFDSNAGVRSVDDRLDVEYALTKLASRQRLALDCFYFVGLSIAETAAVMRCSEGTIKSTLSDARARLQRLLEGRS